MKKNIKTIIFLSLLICMALNTNTVRALSVVPNNQTIRLKGTYCNENMIKFYKNRNGYMRLISHDKLQEAAEDIRKAVQLVNKIQSYTFTVLSLGGIFSLGPWGGVLKFFQKAGEEKAVKDKFKEYSDLSRGSGSCGIIMYFDKVGNKYQHSKTEAQGAVFFM